MNAQMLSSRSAPGRSGPWRAMAVAALAATALLVAACGGPKSPSSASGSTQYQKALAFTKCMRSHGALGVPDPTSAGTITVTQALLNNPQIQSAAHSCKNLLPRNAIQLPRRCSGSWRPRPCSTPRACAHTGYRTSPTPSSTATR